MKTLSFWKKSVYSALVFFGTLMVLSVGYAVWNNVMGQVNSGDSLTAGKWNAFVDNINDLNSRWSRVGSDIAFTGGNVGIGTASPLSNLQIGTQTPASTGTPVTLSLGASYSNTAGANPKLKLYDDGTNILGFGVSSASLDYMAAMNHNWYVAGVNKMTLTSAGKVGIGTVSPADVLTVSGGVTATKFTTSTAWTAIPGNGTWNSGMSCRRVGSFLQFNGNFSIISGTVSGWSVATTFPTLPSNCLPSINISYISAICWNGASASSCLISIAANGIITAYNDTAFATISFPGSYPAD